MVELLKSTRTAAPTVREQYDIVLYCIPCCGRMVVHLEQEAATMKTLAMGVVLSFVVAVIGMAADGGGAEGVIAALAFFAYVAFLGVGLGS